MSRGSLVKANISEVESLQCWTAVQTQNDRTEVVLDKSWMRTARSISPRNCLHNISLTDVGEYSRKARVTVQGILEKSQPAAAAQAGASRGNRPVRAA
jgi:hypothetical protein